MDTSIDQKITNLIEEIKQSFAEEKAAIELKRQEVQKLMKDRVVLDDLAEKLRLQQEDLEKRELELKKNIELNRERTEKIERREKNLEAEKERLQNLMSGI